MRCGKYPETECLCGGWAHPVTEHIDSRYLTNGRFFLYDDGTVESCVHEHQAFGPDDEREECHRNAEREMNLS